MSVSSADRVRPIIPITTRTPRASLLTVFDADEWTAQRIAGHLVQQHAELFGTGSIQFVYGDAKRLEAAICDRLSHVFEHRLDNVLVLTVNKVSLTTYRDRLRGEPLLDDQTWVIDFLLTETSAVDSGVAIEVKVTGYVR